MAEWNLAQLNVARLVAPQGDPRVQPFFDGIDRVNALAESSPGFVWRLKDDSGHSAGIQPTVDSRLIVNMSVWEDVDALFGFVYRGGHAAVMARRREWFEKSEGAHQVLWWIGHGHRPALDEGFARLWHLDRFGPTRLAFTFKARFPPPAGPDRPRTHAGERCVGSDG